MNIVDTDKKLAKLLINYPAIWDRRSSSFKNSIIKENSYQHLASALKIPVQVLKERYRSIREKYRKEKVKYEAETKSEAGQCSGERWELYEYLQFLDEHILTRRRTMKAVFDAAESNTMQGNLLESDEAMLAIASCNDFQDPLKFDDDVSASRASTSSMLSAVSTDDDLATSTANTTQTSKPKKRNLDEQDNFTDIVQKLPNSGTGPLASTSSQNQSRFSWLAAFISTTLESMDPITAENTAREITDIVFQKKIESLKKKYK